MFVSTHAPARGATEIVLADVAHISAFQPTHPHGVRPWRDMMIADTSVFQPTHPHGVRRRYSDSLLMFLLFQPTHPHGVRR